MANKYDLTDWLVEALRANGKSATIVDVCKYIWDKYEDELRASGDLFYTWQYDFKWAATELRKTGVMKPASLCP
ncbi:MAG TPA: hypothetical protein ENI41_06025 [Deltaproteobacteria bacterium]|nr:hypothetical protein [Deltaproteobacteria bacterium]